MEIFERDGKFNFVDENNVFVGYDSTQDCCEDASYILSNRPPASTVQEDVERDWAGWVFDVEWVPESPLGSGELDGGDSIMFRLAKGDEEAFLTLYNSHNGYYGHGFVMDIGGQRVRDGVL